MGEVSSFCGGIRIPWSGAVRPVASLALASAIFFASVDARAGDPDDLDTFLYDVQYHDVKVLDVLFEASFGMYRSIGPDIGGYDARLGLAVIANLKKHFFVSFGYHFAYRSNDKSPKRSLVEAYHLGFDGRVGFPVFISVKPRKVMLSHKASASLGSASGMAKIPVPLGIWIVGGARLHHTGSTAEFAPSLGLRFGMQIDARSPAILIHREWWIEAGAHFYVPAIKPGAYLESVWGGCFGANAFVNRIGLIVEYIPDLDGVGPTTPGFRLQPAHAIFIILKITPGVAIRLST